MWIEGVVNTGEINQLACVTHDGNRMRFDGLPKLLAAPPTSEATSIRFEDLKLSSLQEVFPEEFISLAGYPQCSAPGQSVFEFFAGGVRVLVTAAVLLIALLGSSYFVAGERRAIRMALLNGLTLELVMASLLRQHTSAVHRLRRSTQLAFSERLTWLSNFISPRHTWASVQRYAARGRLDFDMPKASITGAAIGRIIQGTLLADHVYVAMLYPREAPFTEWARDLAFTGFYPEIEFSQTRKAALEDALPTRKDAWELTQFEWLEFRNSDAARALGVAPMSERAQQFLLLRHGFRVHPQSWQRLRAIALDLTAQP